MRQVRRSREHAWPPWSHDVDLANVIPLVQALLKLMPRAAGLDGETGRRDRHGERSHRLRVAGEPVEDEDAVGATGRQHEGSALGIIGAVTQRC